MTAGIIESFDLLHQIAREFNLGDNYDWFSDSGAGVLRFFTSTYGPVHHPESPRNRGKTEAEKSRMWANFENVRRVMTAVAAMYNVDDNGERRQMFSDLYTGKTNDALIPIVEDEDDSEPVAASPSSGSQTPHVAEGSGRRGSSSQAKAEASKSGGSKKKSKNGDFVDKVGAYNLYYKKDAKGKAKMVKVKAKK